ncbi:hypothetical protein MSG28_001085 [Choristoneura fumiferana]|uniref:Uncharacterized protein n=1 Tax=Choristoneura fumiferana TaxID=7141 RepID=A0ACC0K3I7_CHOFU|nr:hypothetical protein MSG28_001085 [Choristoneura fumiferana]
MEALDEKMKTIIEENNILKNKISELEQKLKAVDREKRKNNLVFFGMEERGKSEGELVDYIKDLIVDMGVHMDSHEISNVYRIGIKSKNKNRPVVASITTRWKKHIILKNKTSLPPGIYVKEDYSKEILEKRKQLQPQLEEENKKGNIAYIKYDRLIVLKQKGNNREKRKRVTSDSPKSSAQKKVNKNQDSSNHPEIILKNSKNETSRPNSILSYVNRAAKDHHPLTKRRNRILNIATLNTRTLRTEESLHELEKALEDIKWDILGISEMRRLGEKIEERTDYLLFHKGEIAGQRGVGFIIKKSMKQYIQEIIGISDRIAILNIEIPGYKKLWTIVQIYAPTEQATKTEIELFYKELSQTITRFLNNHLILMGDFNAQVGAKQCKEEYVLGNFGQGKRSPHGELLVEFLLQHNLTLLNSLYIKNQKNKWTWISPDGNTKNEIDYMTTNFPKAFTDTAVVTKFNFNTNHRMVRSNIRIEPLKKSRKYFTSHTTGHYSKEILAKIKQSLIESTDELTTSNIDTHTKYGKIEKLLTQEKDVISRRNKYKLSDKTLQLIELRKLLISKHPKKDHIKSITKLSKEIKENIRNDRKIKRVQTLEKHIVKTGGVKKALKELKESHKEWIPKLKKMESTSFNRKNIQEIATKFYKNLYANSDNKQKNNTKTRLDVNREHKEVPMEPKILPKEVEKAIYSQKMEKAPGPDKVTNELLKGTLEELLPIITSLFNEILATGLIPLQWKISNIILIYKKGHKEDVGNYRPISLMSNIYKVFSKVILERISKKLDENQPREQAGFRQKYSTLDHIHAVKQVIQKYNEYNKNLYMAFIDYSKAFDSIRHTAIWDSLEQQGIPSIYINIIKNIYLNGEARIQLETLGKKFKIERGVRQGDPLSPKLFSAALESIFRKLDWEEYGLNIQGAKLNHLRFADDIVLFEENPTHLSQMIESLNNESMKVGLCMNKDKTKLLTNSVPVTIKIDNQPLEYVSDYIYLGQIISHIDQTTKEIERRIGNGWKKILVFERSHEIQGAKYTNKKKSLQHMYTSSHYLWMRNMGTHQTPQRKAGTLPKSYGKKFDRNKETGQSERKNGAKFLLTGIPEMAREVEDANKQDGKTTLNSRLDIIGEG